MPRGAGDLNTRPVRVSFPRSIILPTRYIFCCACDPERFVHEYSMSERHIADYPHVPQSPCLEDRRTCLRMEEPLRLTLHLQQRRSDANRRGVPDWHSDWWDKIFNSQSSAALNHEPRLSKCCTCREKQNCQITHQAQDREPAIVIDNI